MKRLIILLIVVLLLTLAMAVPAFAQGPGDGGRPTEDEALIFVCDKAKTAVARLGLTPDECEALLD